MAIRIFMHPDILTRLKNADAELFDNLEKEYGRDLSFRGDSSMHHEEFKLVNPENGNLLRQTNVVLVIFCKNNVAASVSRGANEKYGQGQPWLYFEIWKK